MRNPGEPLVQSLSALKPAEIANFNAMLGKLIDTLEARDENGVSLFLERTRPPEE